MDLPLENYYLCLPHYKHVNYSAESQHNVAICQQAINELVLEYGGQEKCPWTLVQMKGKLS